MGRIVTFLLLLIIFGATAQARAADKITIAAAADLKFALDEIVSDFRKSQPGTDIEVVYGSSGKLHTQIRQGAPFDMFFSADISYPRDLSEKGEAASPVKPYGTGRIVLWSNSMDAGRMTLASLLDPKISKIAIANPKHAPYGRRAEEALRAEGLWDRLQPRIVTGENISQTARFIQSKNAQIGIIALSLALSPELSGKGGYYLIPEKLHKPLEQGFIITKRGGNNPLARRFSDHMESPAVRSIMKKYGFHLPGEAK